MTNFFGEGSPYLDHRLLTNERSAREVDRILGWCTEPVVDVLDLGCGFGRHCIEFAHRGLAPTGVDPSPFLLDEARRRAHAEGVQIDFVESGGEVFVREDSFDLAVCLFTTLGQLTASSADAHIDGVLSNLRASVRDGGTLIVEVPERHRAVANLIESEQFGSTNVRRSFNNESNVVSEQFITPNGTYDLAYVVLSEEELRNALEAAGFAIAAIDHEALCPPPNTFMTVVAR